MRPWSRPTHYQMGLASLPHRVSVSAVALGRRVCAGVYCSCGLARVAHPRARACVALCVWALCVALCVLVLYILYACINRSFTRSPLTFKNDTILQTMQKCKSMHASVLSKLQVTCSQHIRPRFENRRLGRFFEVPQVPRNEPKKKADRIGYESNI